MDKIKSTHEATANNFTDIESRMVEDIVSQGIRELLILIGTLTVPCVVVTAILFILVSSL